MNRGSSIFQLGSLISFTPSRLKSSPGKNALITIVSIYIAVSKAETRRPQTPPQAIGCPRSAAADARFHLLTKPANPGTPISAKEDTVKIPNTQGI